jgi:superfamily II DNA or RNA helicase
MKYGKEGLDAPSLDTILVSAPFSQKGALQQLMGRITGRPSPNKKGCVVVFYRDNIGVMHGMCDKLERHLRDWPIDEGGPLQSEHINNPVRANWQKAENLKAIFMNTTA